MKSVLIAAFMMPGVCLALTDPATEIVFPDPAGPWVYTDTRSYSYKPLFGGTGAIACYIYSKGLRNIPTGAESALVRREMDETIASVVEAWTQLGAKVEAVSPPTQFRRGSDGRALAY